MNHFEDGPSDRQEHNTPQSSDGTPLADKSLPTSQNLRLSRPELSSAPHLTRLLIETFLNDTHSEVNELHGLINEPFISEFGAIEIRAIVISGLADAMTGVFELAGNVSQMGRILKLSRQIVSYFEASDQALSEARKALGANVVKLLGVSDQEHEVGNLISNLGLRISLYQISEALLQIPDSFDSESRETLERIIFSELTEIIDSIESLTIDYSIDAQQLQLIEALASCCEAAKSTFFEEPLINGFKVLSRFCHSRNAEREIGKEEDELENEEFDFEDQNSEEDLEEESFEDQGLDSESENWRTSQEDDEESEYDAIQSEDEDDDQWEPVDDQDTFADEDLDDQELDSEDEDGASSENYERFEMKVENAVDALLKALVFCQRGDAQIPLWKSVLESLDPLDNGWTAALTGISLVEPSFVVPIISDFLVKTADHEIKFALKLKNQYQIPQFFLTIIDLVAVNRTLLPDLNNCFNKLDNERRDAVLRTFDLAIKDNHIAYSALSESLNDDFGDFIVQLNQAFS
jgi:hypothetical protein